MPKEKKNSKAIVFWILTGIVMILIFWFSAQPAEESSMQSNFIMQLIIKLFGSNQISELFIRKAAHFCEFALLCFMFNWSFYFTKGRMQRILSLALASAYAASDEVHQIFVEGRACSIIDWMIDTAGAALGLIAFIVLLYIIKKFTQKTDIAKSE